jgi:hypothetical protein
MLKTLMLALTLLVSAAWLQAQQYPQSGSGQTGNTTSRQTKVEGCLQGSNGNFTSLIAPGPRISFKATLRNLLSTLGTKSRSQVALPDRAQLALALALQARDHKLWM